jgi:hypothetical protein
MSRIGFPQDAGEKLFRRPQAAPATEAAAPDSAAPNSTAGQAITKSIVRANRHRICPGQMLRTPVR